MEKENSMSKIMKKLRISMKQISENLDVPDIYFEETRRVDNKTITLMPLIALKSNPCKWLRCSGGCSMCGYQLASSLNKKPSDENLINQTKFVIKRCPSKLYPLITFNSSGSFLDPEEISDELRPRLLKLLKEEGYKEFNFECRPEFLINEKRVKQLKEYFDVVSVGIGLESIDDFIRNEIIHKGTQISTYLKAIEICKRHNIEYDAYIQMGKPFLTAKEDIEDAIKTAEWAFEHGFSRVFLMPCNIQPSTLTHLLWEKNLFNPPMLWSPIEVIKKLPKEKRKDASVRQFVRAVPTPIIFPQNCEKCTAEVVDKLIHWNMTGDFKHIEDMPKCECLKKFEDKLKQERTINLKKQVKEIKQIICEEFQDNK